jgi:hypothetical protein
MGKPTNEPTNEPSVEPTTRTELPNILTSKRGKFSLSQRQDRELSNKISVSITQNISNTSYTFEAVNGVNHNHDKIKVDN